jgi:hypothetical protein
MMNYCEKTKHYLTGVEFSNGACFNLDTEKPKELYRDDYLVNISKGKKVIHFGFVDHLPLIEEKIANGSWLHKKLTDVSAMCYGIDLEKEGIEYIESLYKYKNLFAMNVLSDDVPEEIMQIEFDYILLPDVIEHIGNPVEFLEALRSKFGANAESIIITTPNAFRLINFVNLFRHKECINTDHRFWFTPYTISKVVTDAGYRITSLNLFEHSRLPRKQFLRRLVISIYKVFKDTLVVNASFK